MIHRTNQLNLSGKKYTQEEFDAIYNEQNRQSYIVECVDKYGSYGQVGFISVKDGENLVVDEFAMSCRVANKYVESALFNYLIKKYNKDISISGQVTDRNKLLVDTFTGIGIKNNSTDDKIYMQLCRTDVIKNADVVGVVLCQK